MDHRFTLLNLLEKLFSSLPLLGTQTAMAMAAPTVHGYNLMVAMLKSRTKLGKVKGEKGTLYIFIE